MEPELKNVAEYLQDLRNRAAVTCRIPWYKTHIGHGILQAFRLYPECKQIDAASNRSERYSSVLNRALKLARSLFFYGYQPGDPAVILTTNDLDACLPFYACLFNGHPIVTINYDCDIHNINYYLSLVRPRIIFCHKEKESLFNTALIECDLSIQIIIIGNHCELTEESQVNADFIEYFPLEFDVSTPAFLVMTRGTTGQPKLATVSHEMVWNVLPYNYFYFKKIPKPTKSLFLLSSMQGAIGMQMMLFSVLFGCSKIQSSQSITDMNYKEIIDKYKPTYIMCYTKTFIELLSTCNLTSLEYIHVTGAPSPDMAKIQIDCPNAIFIQTYSLTETFSTVFYPHNPPDNKMRPFLSRFKYLIIDQGTGKEITDSDKIGELYIKDIYQFTGYYHQSKETKKVLNTEGYFKTGDLFYKDKIGNFYFVNRIKKDEH